MQREKPGECVDRGSYLSELSFDRFQMRVPTERYYLAEYHARERQAVWLRVWQVAGRADELPDGGDWKVYAIFDQSYVLVRGKDGTIAVLSMRADIEATRCAKARGIRTSSSVPTTAGSSVWMGDCSWCQNRFDGSTESFVGSKDELGLRQVPVECFAGFIFINPSMHAAPLREYLAETIDLLAPYHLEEMIPADINVRESLDCNWKVVMDAFQEGYHIQGIHPELVAAMDESKERYSFFGDHSVATAPFGASNLVASGPEREVERSDKCRKRSLVSGSAAPIRRAGQCASKRGWRAGVSGWRFASLAPAAGNTRDTDRERAGRERLDRQSAERQPVLPALSQLLSDDPRGRGHLDQLGTAS